MSNELDAGLKGANVLHEGATAIRDFTLTSGGAPVDLSIYTAPPTGFRSDIKNVIDGTLLATATFEIVNPPGTDGVLRWRIEAQGTNTIVLVAGNPQSTGNVAFVMDIEADHISASPVRTDYLGHGAGEVQRKVTN